VGLDWLTTGTWASVCTYIDSVQCLTRVHAFLQTGSTAKTDNTNTNLGKMDELTGIKSGFQTGRQTNFFQQQYWCSQLKGPPLIYTLTLHFHIYFFILTALR